MKARVIGIGATLLAALLAGSPAQSNGRFPAAGQIAADPADPAHLVVRSTYGVLTTRDAGAHWYWICEPSIGYGGSEDPAMAVTKDGSILAGIFAGLSVTHDSGCQWDFVKGGLDGRYVIDLSIEPSNPSRAVLIISNSVGGGVFLTQLWESADNGVSWAQAGTDLPGAFLGLTIDTAPSDPARVYASGRFGAPDYLGVLERSKDRGKTWEDLLIPNSNDQHLPYLCGVAPKDPDLLYVRLDGDADDRLLVSKDGGEKWTEVFQTTGALLGFALSPDGTTLAVGVSAPMAPEVEGLWTAPADTLQFQKVSTVGARCLTWTAAGLYACGNEFVDAFTVGVSTDRGKSFSPLMHLDSLCGPLACDPASTTGKSCPDLWGPTKESINGATCEDADAGTSDAGTTTPRGESGGCACGIPGGDAGNLVPGIALAVAAALLRRRTRPAR